MKKSDLLKIAGNMASGILSNPACINTQNGNYGYQQVLQDCVNGVFNVVGSMGLSINDPEDGANSQS